MRSWASRSRPRIWMGSEHALRELIPWVKRRGPDLPFCNNPEGISNGYIVRELDIHYVRATTYSLICEGSDADHPPLLRP